LRLSLTELKMKFIVFSCIFAFCFGKIVAQSCHLRELDLCAATLLVFTQNPSGIAQTDADLNKQCGYLHEADGCFKNYTRKCSTYMQRELITFLSEGSTRLLNEYCTEGTPVRQNYLKHAPCLNEAQKGQRGCVKDLQAALETVTSVDWTNRIAAGCCSFRRFQGCTEGLVEQKCGTEAVEFMHILLRMALSKVPDIVCQGYGPENPTCKTLLPPSGTNPKGAKSGSVLSRLFSAYTGY